MGYMEPGLKGKTALVTGTGSRIGSGKAIAVALAMVGRILAMSGAVSP